MAAHIDRSGDGRTIGIDTLRFDTHACEFLNVRASYAERQQSVAGYAGPLHCLVRRVFEHFLTEYLDGEERCAVGYIEYHVERLDGSIDEVQNLLSSAWIDR